MPAKDETMRIVCLDTQVLYWAILGKAAAGSEPLIPRARDFLIGLTANEDVQIIVPTTVLGELLAFVAEANQGNVLASFQRDWLIVDYDVRAALVFGQMRANRFVQAQFKSLQADHPDATRHALSADCMIIATAIAHSATVIYSADRHLLTLADGWIEAKRFEDESYQMRLIDVDED